MFSLFNKSKDYRLLLLGSKGKTTFLYYNKLKEQIKTIPTIGFNVEKIDFTKDITFTCWDVGGCDRIQPLIKHYYEGTDGIIFFISTMKGPYSVDYSFEILDNFIDLYNLPKVPLVLFCVDRDLSEDLILSDKELKDKLMLYITKIKDRPVCIHYGCSFKDNNQGKGHIEVFTWLDMMIRNEKSKDKKGKEKEKEKEKEILKEKDKTSKNVYEWMDTGDIIKSIPESPTDELDDLKLISQIENFDLPSWDHKTHLRLAFIVLKKEIRRDAIAKIFKLIEDFIAKSKRTTGKTFHVTMTYFWIHMIFIAITYNPDCNFTELLTKNMWLLNGQLFKHFYSNDLMLKNEESRKIFVPPDLNKLPDVLK